MDFKTKVMILGAMGAALALLVLVKKKGAAEAVGAAAVDAAVDLATGVTVGALDGISGVIGIPTTKQTITDAGECRRYMDANGWYTGTWACSTGAFNEAIQPVQAVKETASSIWDWFSLSPSPSDYKPPKPTTGAFDRQ